MTVEIVSTPHEMTGSLPGKDPLHGSAVDGLDFTAVDFETANGFRGSPCAVGLVRIRNGREVDSLYRRMRPPEGFDRFDPRNVAIHGITAESVATEPRFAELFNELAGFIGGDLLVAHQAAFDIEVFESALEVSGLDSPGLEALCSVRLARAVYRLPSHALPAAAAEAGYQLTHHHWALEDARACAAVVIDISRRRGMAPVKALFSAEEIPAEILEPWQGEREFLSRATRQVRSYGRLFDARAEGVDPAELPDLMRWQDEGRNLEPNAQADPQHPLFGQHLVFSGTLGVPRSQAKALSADCGAQTASRVTGSTTIVVVGDGVTAEELPVAGQPTPVQSPATAAALNTRKVQDALRRRESGQQLRLIAESQFRALLGQLWPLPLR